jgi:hypothetical protein
VNSVDNNGFTKSSLWLLNQARLMLLVLICVALLPACASFSQSQALTLSQQTGSKAPNEKQITIAESTENDKPAEKGWWEIGFHRLHGDNEDVQWQYDTFIAHQILKPIIKGNQELTLWRFHRRASSDKAGHRFGFIFYANRKVGETIYQSVNDHPTVKALLSTSHVERLSFYDINQELRSDIENTSDGKWPIELQKTWPYFIMGVSQTWLGLVEYYYAELDLSEEAGLDDQLTAFKEVSASIDLLWKQNGSHAFLHHLNALFAYQELYVIERSLTRF